MFPVFNDFDPKSKFVGYFEPFQLASIARRARAILKSHSTENISDIACQLSIRADDWIDEYVEKYKEELIRDLSERGGYELAYLRPEDRDERGIRGLLENWPSDADDSSPLDDAARDIRVIDTLDERNTAIEYAVLALWKVAESLTYLKGSGSLDGPTLIAAGECAIEAMEAICCADRLSAVRTLRSAFGAHAAHARHVETRQLKEEVWEWCPENLQKYPSVDAAAEAVAGTLVPVTFRTAQKWIAEYRRKHTVSAQTVHPASKRGR